MTKLRILKIEREYVQSENGDMHLVSFEIFTPGEKEDIVLAERKLHFPLTLSEKEMKKELKKYLDTFIADESRKNENAELEAAYKKSDKTIENLSDLELEGDEISEAPELLEEEEAEDLTPEEEKG